MVVVVLVVMIENDDRPCPPFDLRLCLSAPPRRHLPSPTVTHRHIPYLPSPTVTYRCVPLQLATLQQSLGEATRVHSELADALQAQYLKSERSLSALKQEITDLEDVIEDQVPRDLYMTLHQGTARCIPLHNSRGCSMITSPLPPPAGAVVDRARDACPFFTNGARDAQTRSLHHAMDARHAKCARNVCNVCDAEA